MKSSVSKPGLNCNEFEELLEENFHLQKSAAKIKTYTWNKRKQRIIAMP